MEGSLPDERLRLFLAHALDIRETDADSFLLYRAACSAASHIAAIIADKAFSSLKAPVKRVTVPNVSMPYAPNAENHVLPNEDQIAHVATDLARS